MRTIILITLVPMLISCGVEIEGLENLREMEVKTPEKIDVSPDFEKAAQFCDDRYGINTIESEQCFKDYRDYFKIDVNLNLNHNVILQFCESRYFTEIEIESCENELQELIENQNQNQIEDDSLTTKNQNQNQNQNQIEHRGVLC